MAPENSRLDADTALLIDRIRVGLWLILASMIVFAAADLRYANDKLLPLYLLKLAGLLGVVIAFRTLRRCRSRRDGRIIALLVVGLGSALSALSGVITNDMVTTPILGIVMSLGMAMLLPWGTLAQVIGTTLIAFAIFFNAALVSGAHPFSAGYPMIAVIVAFGASIAAARQLERHRHAILQGQVALQRSAMALAESERRYRDLFENANDAIFTLDLNGRFVSCNRATEKLTGYDRAVLRTKNVVDVLPPEHAMEVGNQLERLRSGNWSPESVTDPVTAVRKVKAADGREVIVEVNAQVLIEDGRPVGIEAVARDVTARRAAEYALRESERRLRDLASHVPGIIYQFQLHPDGSFTFPFVIDSPYLKMLGLSAEQIQKDPGLGFSNIHPDDAAVLWQAIGRLSEDVMPPPAEFRMRTASGEERWFRANSTTRRLPDGSLLSTGLLIDITDRKRAEQTIVQLAAIVESSGDAIIGLSLDGTITTWNKGAESVYGYTAEEARGAQIGELLAPGRIDEVTEILGRVARGEKVHNLETMRRRKDGEWIHVSLSVSPVKDTAGRIVGASTIARDISERKQMEEALRAAHGDLERRVTERTAELSASNELLRREIDDRQRTEKELMTARETAWEAATRFSAVLNAVEEGIVTIDSNGVIVLVNPEAEKIWGYTREELIGSNLQMLMPEHYREAHARGLKRYMQTGESHILGRRLELEGLKKDGTLFPIELRIAEMRIGERTLFTAAVRDITERKRVEADLQLAKEAAEAASRAKSEFLANVSHEIRTPLNAVIGMTGLMLDTKLTPEQREFAETIRSAGSALLTLINDLLDFSKVESGRIELEMQPFDLRSCIEGAFDLLAPHAAQQGVEMAYFMDERTPEAVVGDVGRVRQVLVNLLSNAVRFTHQGEVVVSVTAEELAENGDDPASSGPEYLLRFAVQDTGVGIPKERFDRLFQSFSQVDASTTRRYGGTGLGLAISKRLTELMGGTIGVESEVNRGSTFHFTIRARGAEPRLSLRTGAASLSGKRVLLVEPHPTQRRMLVHQLELWNMEIFAAHSGIEVIDALRGGKSFDIALISWQLPDLDGAALAREIRGYRDAAQLPLVLLAPLGRWQGERGDDGEIRSLFTTIITKPIKLTELYRALLERFSIAERLPAGAPVAPRVPRLAERLPLRILLAEDNEVNQRVALRMLARMGYRADVAASGIEVLQALKRQHYDVVLLDVQMPEMDGLQAAREICASWPPNQRPALIAMTAHALRGTREECLAAGMDDYIAKPVEAEDLAAALERVGGWRGEQKERRNEPVPPAIDRTVFERLRRDQAPGEPDLVSELIEVFLHYAPQAVEDLRCAIARRDGPAINQIAHRLKSSSAQLGARRMSALCADIEARGDSGNFDGVDSIFDSLAEEFERVRSILAQEVEARGGGIAN